MRHKWRWLLLLFALVTLSLALYVRTHPLVFNEAFWEHAHCIKIAGMALENYADQHGGKFPFDPKGYGNALLLLEEDAFFALTGPGYDAAPFLEARRKGTDLPEEECGRVYVQGLTRKSNPDIALLFDKLPTPGGDHCHFPQRLWAPLGREVLFIGGRSEFIEESSWAEFARRQVALLAKEGMPRQEAERLFASKPRQ